MAPPPAIPGVLEQGQTTLDFSSSSTIKKKPGKPAQLVTKAPPRVHRQWMSGSLHKSTLARQFQTARIVNFDPYQSDPEGYALHRFSYSRELKLSAVEWACNTYVKGEKDGEPDKLISRYAAVKRLGITSTMLRSWTQNKARITNQKKGSRRGRFRTTKGREDKMERALFTKFKEARKVGKGVGCQWFRRYAKAIYR
jgi:hypothetical protein